MDVGHFLITILKLLVIVYFTDKLLKIFDYLIKNRKKKPINEKIIIKRDLDGQIVLEHTNNDEIKIDDDFWSGDLKNKD